LRSTRIITNVERKRNRERISRPGEVALGQRPPTAKGFVFITVEVEDGLMNVIVKPDVYQRCYMVLRTDF
jgi:DNA polymerase-3 subunit alpha/error-prone DNA polymerase